MQTSTSRWYFAASVLLTSALMAEVAVSGDHAAPAFDPTERLPAGSATYQGKLSKKALMHPAPNISFEDRMDFNLGNSLFEKLWVSSPSSTTASDGLGPLYNARSCARCHARVGRGHAPDPTVQNDSRTSMLMRLSIPAQTPQQKRLLAGFQAGVIDEPMYGSQLQDLSVQGLPAEGQWHVTYTPHEVVYPDGRKVVLRKPSYRVDQLAYGDLHPDVMLSPRVAQPMIGLGLLAAIETDDILTYEDELDRNHDGISGRANRVWNQTQGQIEIGRFGWKAGHPTLLQQNNSAFLADIGISTTTYPYGQGECTHRQEGCLALPNGNSEHLDSVEASAEMARLVTFYVGNLAVPAARNVSSPAYKAGREAFYMVGCQSCHRPSYLTSTNAPKPQAQQRIWPYTDLLLHDMGEGLADNRPEFLANGREWRTAPLWGVGLTELVNGHNQLLHDGRARSVEEAILWHGGEAEAVKQRFMQLPKTQRENLIRFVESL